MSMTIQRTLAYGNYQNEYHASKLQEKKETQESQNTEKAVNETFVSNGEKQLSKAAQKLLQTLRTSRTDMDFMVADFDKGDNAKEILSHSHKEFTVVYSSEELERMAIDEKYFNQKMHSIERTLLMSEEINEQFGFGRAFGQTENAANDVAMTKSGIAFNRDGSTTLFAELEKISNRQREWLEKIQEKKAEEKKEQLQDTDTKRTTVLAATQKELLEKISTINWNLVTADTAETVGRLFDYSI